LAALGIDAGLLVLRRRPLGMAAHRMVPLSFPAAAPGCSARWARTISTNSACTRRSPVSSGWKLVATRFPWRTATTLPSAAPPTTPPSTSTASTASPTHAPAEHLDVLAGLLDPRRADEDRVHVPAGQADEGDVGLERVDLPAEG